MIVQFTVPGVARSYQTKNKIGQGRVYEDEDTPSYHWMQAVKGVALQNRPPKMFDEPLGMVFVHVKKRPARRKTPDHYFAETSPDFENTMKVFVDAMEGIIFKDDSRICYVLFSREWGPRDGVVVKIGPVREMIDEIKETMEEIENE